LRQNAFERAFYAPTAIGADWDLSDDDQAAANGEDAQSEIVLA
jgi:hypothetical protein